MKSHVFYRRLTEETPVAVRGRGIHLFDSAGKEYIDGSGGALVINVGHGVPEIARAVAEQAEKLAYVNSIHFSNEAVEALASEIAGIAHGLLTKVFTLSSGSAATEAAIKLARQYWLDRGRSGKYKMIARTPGYHGNTLSALSASGRPESRKKFGPLLNDFAFVRAPMAYRTPEGISFEDHAASCVRELEDVIAREGSESIAAFIAEPVIGASAGAVGAPRGYFSAIKKICERHEILFIADEVLCGMGRTGIWLAIEREGVVPDILTLGKGLSGGYAPLSALVTTDEIVDTLAQNSGAFSYNQTFSHTPLAAAAGVATFAYIKEHALIDRAKQMGQYFLSKLESLRQYEMVGDVRGIGLLAGIEYVADRISKQPFHPDLNVAGRVQKAAAEEGLILWSTNKYMESGEGDLSVLGPPFTISESEIDELVQRLSRAIRRVNRELQESRSLD